MKNVGLRDAGGRDKTLVASLCSMHKPFVTRPKLEHHDGGLFTIALR